MSIKKAKKLNLSHLCNTTVEQIDASVEGFAGDIEDRGGAEEIVGGV